MADFTRIASVDELEPLFETSRNNPLFIFKHSLTCPISSAALREYESFVEQHNADAPPRFTLVEIQKARDVSQAIAERTGVRHESPQALLLRDGQVAWHASHWSIKVDSLQKALAG